MTPITPCLWFDGTAQAAVDLYLSVFLDSRRLSPEGSDVVIEFELEGRPFQALNGGPMYTMTPAISFSILCADQQEVDHYWESLLVGGEPSRCGWLTDRFGVSWQVVPARLGELMSDPDPDRRNRVMQAMLQMVKLDIAGLEAAADAAP